MKSGAGAAIFGKGCDPTVGRCVGAGGNVGPDSGGRGVSPAEPFREVTEVGCLWSSLPKL